MATELEMALFSYNSYRPHPINTMPLPDGWILSELSRPSGQFGFAADVFVLGGEVVIAFRGTDGAMIADWQTAHLDSHHFVQQEDEDKFVFWHERGCSWDGLM